MAGCCCAAAVSSEPATYLVCACPSCATRLRVDEDQLAIANGQVRCGACLAVFDGRAHLVAPQQPPTPTEVPPTPSADAETTPSAPEPTDAPPPEQLVEDAAAPPAPDTDDEAPEPAQAEPEPPPETQDTPVPDTDDEVPVPAQAEPERPPKRERRSISHRALGALGMWSPVATLALLLIVNVLRLQFDSWTQLPLTRGFYAQACDIVNCELPPLRSLADIALDNDDADSRPGPPNQLTLTATLVNRAQFPQPFPTLTVHLFAANDKKLAQHRIPPATYLEDLGDKTAPSMTPNQPTPITLRMDDPGTEAISYAITMQ